SRRGFGNVLRVHSGQGAIGGQQRLTAPEEIREQGSIGVIATTRGSAGRRIRCRARSAKQREKPGGQQERTRQRLVNCAVLGQRLVAGSQALQESLDLKQRTRVGRRDAVVVSKDRIGHQDVAQACVI